MFWDQRTPATKFRWFHLHSICGAALFGWHQRSLPPTVWQSLVGFRLLTSVSEAWRWSRMQNLRTLNKNDVYGPKFTKFWGNIADPLCFQTPLLDYLSLVLFGRYLPLSLEVVEKLNKCESVFGPKFFWEGRSQLFYGELLARSTVHRLTKFGWVPFAHLRLRSLAMK